MGVTSQFLDGVAQLLVPAGFVFRSSGVYAANEQGVVFSVVPSSPDRVVILTPYSSDDDPTLADSTRRIQVRTRGTRDPRTSTDMQDAAFGVLQNLPRQQVGGLTVAGCWRRSTAYLGVDDNGRHEDSSNYEFALAHPTQFRP